MNKYVLPPTYLLASIVLMGLIHFLAPIARIIAYPYNLIGFAPIVAGVILNVVADAASKKHGTTAKPFEKSTTLITSGVLGHSRHPMYLGMVLILFGIAVLMGSATPFLVVAVFGAVMQLVFVKI